VTAMPAFSLSWTNSPKPTTFSIFIQSPINIIIINPFNFLSFLALSARICIWEQLEMLLSPSWVIDLLIIRSLALVMMILSLSLFFSRRVENSVQYFYFLLFISFHCSTGCEFSLPLLLWICFWVVSQWIIHKLFFGIINQCNLRCYLFGKYVKGLTNLSNVSDKNWQISQRQGTLNKLVYCLHLGS
jgi:hypothetical protein